MTRAWNADAGGCAWNTSRLGQPRDLGVPREADARAPAADGVPGTRRIVLARTGSDRRAAKYEPAPQPPRVKSCRSQPRVRPSGIENDDPPGVRLHAAAHEINAAGQPDPRVVRPVPDKRVFTRGEDAVGQIAHLPSGDIIDRHLYAPGPRQAQQDRRCAVAHHGAAD